MKADPDVQRRLLDLQAIDTALAQLAHRRRTLPEHVEISRLASQESKLEDTHITAQAAVDDLDRDIARLERDIDQVRVRREKNQARLDAGSGPSRELEALIHEIATLDRRQSALEESALELMERREQAQSALDNERHRVRIGREAKETAERRRDEVLVDMAKDEKFRLEARRALAEDLPSELVTLYERIREQTGGFGAAALRGNRCEGCRLELSGSDLVAIRSAAPDEVIQHDDCRRILVRIVEPTR